MNSKLPFLSALFFFHAPAFSQSFSIRVGSQIIAVPEGSPALKNEFPSDYQKLPFSSGISNGTSRVSILGTSGFTQVDATVKTENFVSEPFPRSGGESYTISKDILVIADSSPGTSRRLLVEFEISGEYHVERSVFTLSDNRNFIDGISLMKIRLESSRDVSVKEIRTSLKTVLEEEGGPVPRLVTGVYSFRAAGSTFVTYDRGQEVMLTTDAAAAVDYAGENYLDGTPPAQNTSQFERLADIGKISCDYHAGITRLVVTAGESGALEAPLITSASGHNYNTLLTPPPPFQIIEIRPNAIKKNLKLTWNSSGQGNFFRVLATGNPAAPRSTWDVVGNNVATEGPLTTITVPFLREASQNRFFVVEKR